MTIVEKIAVSTFLGMVVFVYWMEFRFVFVFALNKIKGRRGANPLVRKYALIIHCLAVGGVSCFLYGYFVEPYRIEVTTIEIQTDKLRETSFRIVQISDTHCDLKLRNEKRLVKLVNSVEPDVVVFTGDSINTPGALPAFKEMMCGLDAEVGKYAVRGNFDAWYWSRLDVFDATGFDVLDEKSVTVVKGAESIRISGLGVGHSELCSQVLNDVSAEQFSVLLYHYPDLIEEVGDLKVDLYLAGHTHGGQVALPLYGALVTLSKHGKKYEAGKYVVGGTILYVNRGIGMEGGRTPRVRFWARPEITVFDIVPARKGS